MAFPMNSRNSLSIVCLPTVFYGSLTIRIFVVDIETNVKPLKTKKMKKRTFKNLNEFVLWLDSKYEYIVKGSTRKFKSGKMYEKYIIWGLSDLGIRTNDFLANSTPGLIKAYVSALNDSKVFARRSDRRQAEIISGFKAYIKFLNTATV